MLSFSPSLNLLVLLLLNLLAFHRRIIFPFVRLHTLRHSKKWHEKEGWKKTRVDGKKSEKHFPMDFKWANMECWGVFHHLLLIKSNYWRFSFAVAFSYFSSNDFHFCCLPFLFLKTLQNLSKEKNCLVETRMSWCKRLNSGEMRF